MSLFIKGTYMVVLLLSRTVGENFYKNGQVIFNRLIFLLVNLSFIKWTSLYWSSSIF